MQNNEDSINTARQAYDSGQHSYHRALDSSNPRSRARQNDLNEAISHYESALRIITLQEPDPNLWAQIQHALGDAYRAKLGPDAVKDLRKAIECYQNSLQVLTYDNWNQAQQALVATSSTLSQQLAQKTLPSALASFQPLIAATQGSWRWLRARPILLPLLLVVLILAIIVAPLGAFAYSQVASDKFKCVPDSRPLNISGSTALAPLAKKVALLYESKCPGARINVNQVNASQQGSLNGLRAVENGSMDIGLSDVPADATQSDLVDHQVAIVIFALVVNSKVTGISNLSSNQIRAIYNGSTLSNNASANSDGELKWSGLGSSSNLDIVRVSRPPTSGTRVTFETYILQNPETITGPQSLITDTSQAVANEVRTIDGAIGYISLCYAELTPACSANQSGQTAAAGSLKILAIDGHQPARANVFNESYPFWNVEHMYTKQGTQNALATAFINYMTGTDGQQIAQENGFISTGDNTNGTLQKVLNDHQIPS